MAGSMVARNSNLKRLEVGDGVEGSNSRKEKEKEKKMANSKQHPLLQMIFAAVIAGIIFSFFYVFSVVYFSSPHSTTTSTSILTSTWWLPRFPFHSERGGKKLVKPIWEVPPPGSERPPLETFRLRKELVEERVKDNIIIVTFGNYAFLDFILSWVKHLTDLGLQNLLVGAMDMKVLDALYWKGIPVYDMGSNMTTLDPGWGSPAFHKMGREKVILIDAILPFGYELLMCDTDMIWLKNPLPYLSRFPEADVLTSTDVLTATFSDDSLDNWKEVGNAYNIGIFHWRPTDSAKKLAKEWKDLVLADAKLWDQQGFNDIIRRKLGPSVDEDSGLVYAHDGNLKLGLLPASIFCSGHTYFVQAMYQQLRLEPYATHTTYQLQGTAGKRHRLREAMLFYDPPEYYNSPGGLLTFKLSIPKILLLDGQHNIESHFALVNYQTKQIRTALAIASLLNRTLVMPPLWCRFDSIWFPHPGIVAGTMTKQPFLCPLDHVFALNTMMEELPEEEFGPGINWREYSFLDNPSLPKQVKESWLDVQLCQEELPNCQVPPCILDQYRHLAQIVVVIYLRSQICPISDDLDRVFRKHGCN
ncbi:hypothetical protein TEA_007232 [Camellia sinensis var. sinensis]|uniref:Nucleotide-diphospho-sugar transferase domain-containing protein n=1 Tax=Camellia sinensis var. sinensis TaxID=542762 RepID=A0A4S4E7Q0_CAMSN|nr:hypothetical protein TEA_007232 [Camellia sinensis var. sinensis]